MGYDPLDMDPHRDFAEEDAEYESDMAYDPLEWDPLRDFAEEDVQGDDNLVDLTGFSQMLFDTRRN